MKVLLINGSPNERGCTYTALSEVAAVLNKNGAETEFVYLGKKETADCIACGKCVSAGKCIFDDVNDITSRLDAIDGMIIGSPVYFAGPSGRLTSFLDRLFFSSSGKWAGKLGASVVSCRRGGASASFDRLNKYFSISNMPIVSSNYWNIVHGTNPDEVKRDEEGMQTMRILGENMSWLLRCISEAKKAGVQPPQYEKKIKTNFIR